MLKYRKMERQTVRKIEGQKENEMQRGAIRESQNQISDILQSIVEHEELQHNINLSHDGKGCRIKNIIYISTLKGFAY